MFITMYGPVTFANEQNRVTMPHMVNWYPSRFCKEIGKIYRWTSLWTYPHHTPMIQYS